MKKNKKMSKTELKKVADKVYEKIKLLETMPKLYPHLNDRRIMLYRHLQHVNQLMQKTA